MPFFDTRDLAIYASIVGTLNGAWVLYHGIIRDRPRIVVRAYKAAAIPTGFGQRYELFGVSVANRGRRPVNLDNISRLDKLVRGTAIMTMDFAEQLAEKPRLEESQSRTFIHGQRGGYKHGDLPTSRWYVVDGAGRIHPLRERYRQRVLSFVFWPIRRVLNWRERRARKREKPEPDDLIDV